MEFFNNVINGYGFLIAVILLIPDIFFIKTHRIDRTMFDNRAMLYIMRTGKYCSLFLTAFKIGVLEEGFTSALMERFWLITVTVLTAVCVFLWILCFKKVRKSVAYLLSVTTAIVFMLSGLLQVKTLLLTAGVIYLVGQLYVTKKYLDNNL